MTHIRKNRAPTLVATVAVVGLVAAACGYHARLASILVSPDTSVTARGSQQFTAEGRDARGALFAITPAWSVVASGGTINDAGLFTAGPTAGTFLNTVKATDGDISGSASVKVTAPSPVLATITVTPAGPDSLPAATTRQFLAQGKDSAGNNFVFMPTWSIVAGGGTISTAGLFTAGTVPGVFANTIKASSGNVAGYATVTVGSSAAVTVAALATMQELVHFAYDKSDLTTNSRAALDAKVKVFQANPAMRILIVGHTDDRGTGAYNLALGTRRAEAVRDYLVAQGVASNRIDLETRGETQPLASGSSEGAMAQNRRDAFLIRVASDSMVAPKK
ncbi:MAG TPA: OmpA family protein [Gemmatimonadales bacterium]|nr:OmpA family protein [Gemmatimonadales bacterium]